MVNSSGSGEIQSGLTMEVIQNVISSDTDGQQEKANETQFGRQISQPKSPIRFPINCGCNVEASVRNFDMETGAKDQSIKEKQQLERKLEIVPTKKRYFILLMFVSLHMIKSFQWICLASITNVIARFYRVDNLAINWTTILFMVTFLILAMPVSLLMEKIGLRRAVLIGAFGVTCGVTIKCFSCHHEGFLYCMIGHLIVGLAEPFFFSSYSQVASVWFPDDQVAMATACSMIGEELGLALGFIIPPLMIGSDPDDDQTIQAGMFRLFLAVAIISSLNTILIVLFFDEKPKHAPGIARYKQILQEERRRRNSQAVLSEQLRRKIALAAKATSVQSEKKANGISGDKLASSSDNQLVGSVSEFPRPMASRARELRESVSQQIGLSRDILLNKNFILLLVGFGLNVGTVYSIHTLLNQMITKSFPSIEIGSSNLIAIEEFPSLGNLNSTIGQSNLVQSISFLVPQNQQQQQAQTIVVGPVAAIDSGDGIQVASNGFNNSDKIGSFEKKWTDDGTSLVVGNTGLISILAGLLGSAVCGYILDKYHRYKSTAIGLYLLTLISMIILTACLRLANPIVLYLVAVPLGFAFTGYTSCGFDYGVEITYPNPELLSSTLLNISAQICGIPISLIGSVIVDTYGGEGLGLFFCAILTIGFLFNCLQGGQLKRQDAVNEGQHNGLVNSRSEPPSC